MPKWRFLVARHFGSSHQRRQTCERIKDLVQQQRLSSLLPMIKYELSRGREYYLGLAVAGSKGLQRPDQLEETARRILKRAGITSADRQDQSPLLEVDQAHFLHGTLGCESFTELIRFEPATEPNDLSTHDLLEELVVIDLRTPEPDPVENEQYSRLLLWCTSSGSGELARLRDCGQKLGILKENDGGWPLLRRLVLLGHLEFDGGARYRWGIIPPTAVTCEADCDQKFLVGQRAPSFIQRLQEHCNIEECPQPYGPSRLLIRNVSDDVFSRAGVHDAGCVSHQLSELLPTIDDWSLCLRVWDERDFARFETEAYDPESDEFLPVSPITGTPNSSFYRFSLDGATRGSVTLAYYDHQRNHWISGDYYGLRFLARARLGLCRVSYHKDAQQLLIPLRDHWPMPYERALVLASGTLPQYAKSPSGLRIITYQGITERLANRMCQLLDLKLEVH